MPFPCYFTTLFDCFTWFIYFFQNGWSTKNVRPRRLSNAFTIGNLDSLRAGFEPAQNLSSRFVEWSWKCAVIFSFELLGTNIFKLFPILIVLELANYWVETDLRQNLCFARYYSIINLLWFFLTMLIKGPLEDKIKLFWTNLLWKGILTPIMYERKLKDC